MSAGYGAVVPQLFYFPILYATYFYPRHSLYVAGSCAAAYLVIAYSSITLDPIIVTGIVFQALLFIMIAIGSGYVLRSKDHVLYQVPGKEDDAIEAMIKAGESGHREFKLQALGSAHLTKEEIAASESLEGQKIPDQCLKVHHRPLDRRVPEYRRRRSHHRYTGRPD